MENITIGHWIFALISLLIYIIMILWSYWKEEGTYRQFNYKIIHVMIYMFFILTILILIS